MRLVAQRAGVRHAADKSAHTQVAFAVPAVLCVSGEIRHTLLRDVKPAVGRTVYGRYFDGSVETEVFQPLVGICHLGGTVKGGSVGTLEVDSGRQCAQVHETAIGIAYRYVTKRHVGIAQLEAFVGTVPEVAGGVHHEVAENLGMPHQLQEDGGSAGIHLKLILDFASTRDVGGDKVDVVDDAAEIILRRSAYIAADTQGELAFSVRQQEAGSLRFVDVRQLRLIHDADYLIARLVYGDQYDTFGRLVFDNHFFLRVGCNCRQSCAAQQKHYF